MKNSTFATLGIDIGKNSVHIFGASRTGAAVLRKRLTRRKLFELLANTPRALVGMEACPGSNFLAREIGRLGHDVRLIPAQYVKPFLKTNKKDYLDAEAIAEAVTRPTMRFVPVKSIEQLDLQTIHRIRDRMVYQRTSLISQIRSFLLEYGVVMASGVAAFKRDLPRKLAEQAECVSPEFAQGFVVAHAERASGTVGGDLEHQRLHVFPQTGRENVREVSVVATLGEALC